MDGSPTPDRREEAADESEEVIAFLDELSNEEFEAARRASVRRSTTIVDGLGNPVGGGRVIVEVICCPREACRSTWVERNKEKGGKAYWRCGKCGHDWIEMPEIGKGDQRYTRAKMVASWMTVMPPQTLPARRRPVLSVPDSDSVSAPAAMHSDMDEERMGSASPSAEPQPPLFQRPPSKKPRTTVPHLEYLVLLGLLVIGAIVSWIIFLVQR